MWEGVTEEGKKASSGGGWRRKEYDKGPRLVRTRQWPMSLQEGWGHAHWWTRSEHTEIVESRGSWKPVQSTGKYSQTHQEPTHNERKELQS